MIRLFVGLRFPKDIELSLKALCNGLPGAKWVDPRGYHLTLRFIGDVDNRQAEDVDVALAAISAKKFSLRLKSTSHFGPPENAHTVWAGVERSDSLYHLRDKIESAVVRTGFESDHRRFTPHVTLAKLKHTPQEWLESFLVNTAQFQTPYVPIEEFVLFSSSPGDQGRLYLPEATYPLS